MRYEKHKKKKKRRSTSILLVFLVLVGATAGYAFYQYKQGVNQSLEKMKNEEAGSDVNNEEFTFEGKKDQYGATNILLLGSDARGEEKARADTIMIAHYNENQGTFKLTSIMRDSYLAIPGHGKHKLNSAFALGGPELMRQTIKQNFDI